MRTRRWRPSLVEAAACVVLVSGSLVLVTLVLMGRGYSGDVPARRLNPITETLAGWAEAAADRPAWLALGAIVVAASFLALELVAARLRDEQPPIR